MSASPSGMATRFLIRLVAPLLLLTATGCQMAAGDEAGTTASFSTDSPSSGADAPEVADGVPTEDPSAEPEDVFAWTCEGIADEVAYCQSELPLWEPEADVAVACMPEDAALGLACCNAFGGDHCALACEAGDVMGAGDLAEIEGYFDGYVDASSRVVATCGASSFEDVVAAEANTSSELLESHGLEAWGEGEARAVEDIGGLYLMGFSELRVMLDDLGHDEELVAWAFDQQVSNDEGELLLTKWVFFYPRTGVVVVLEGAIGFV